MILQTTKLLKNTRYNIAHALSMPQVLVSVYSTSLVVYVVSFCLLVMVLS